MKIEKRKIADLPMVYVTAELTLGGRRYLAAVSEAPGERAYLVDPQNLSYTDLWIGDTGVMNVVQIPGRDQLLTITKFYPVFQSKEATICLLTPTQKGYASPWTLTPVQPLPFCHRIGVVRSEHGLFLLACQLCADKAFQEDWSQPGALYMTPIPQDPREAWTPTKIFDGLTQNHGLFIENENQVYICSQNGVMHFDLARYQAGETARPTLLSTAPASDIFVAPGAESRMAGTIEPFHGNTAAVYRLTDTAFEKLASFPLNFGHVVWAGVVFGRNALIVGNRGGEKALELIYWETGETVTLDRGVGPTQISVYPEGDALCVFSANHGAGEISLYLLRA